MLIFRMSTTLISYICVGLDIYKSKLSTLITFTYRLRIRHTLMHWNPCSIFIEKHDYFSYRINISGCTQHSKWQFKHYVPNKSSCASTLWTRGSNKVFYNKSRNRWLQISRVMKQHIHGNIFHPTMYMFVPKLTISSSFNGIEEAFWQFHW